MLFRQISLILLGVFFAFGCVEEDGADVSGAILGSDFYAVIGSAEADGNGYTITIADDSSFGCSVFPSLPSSYLSVVISPVSSPTTLPAAGIVFFNNFQDGINQSEAAESGSVTILSVDEETRQITGELDASGATSSVYGSFAVQICD